MVLHIHADMKQGLQSSKSANAGIIVSEWRCKLSLKPGTMEALVATRGSGLHDRRVPSVFELAKCEDLTQMQFEMHGDIGEILRTPQLRTTDNRVYQATALAQALSHSVS